MTYNTNIKSNVKQLPFGAYKLNDRDGQVSIVTDYNTRVIYVDDQGHVMKRETIPSLFRYHRAQAAAKLAQKTRGLRHYVGMFRLLRDFAQ